MFPSFSISLGGLHCKGDNTIIVFVNESASISFVFLWYILLAHRDLELGPGRGYVMRGVGTCTKRRWVGKTLVGHRSCQKKEGRIKENGKDYGIF